MTQFHRPCIIAALLAFSLSPALAQEGPRYPVKPVSIIIPNAPGASMDVFARLYSDKLSAAFGQPFVIDFKPGASGTIASAFVAKATPDGHLLLITTPSFTIVPLQYKDLPYDTSKSFTPVAMMTKAPYVMVVNADFPAKNLKEYIAYAKDKPGVINVATTGSGAFNHLAAEWIHSATGTQASFIHYKGGTAYVPDLVSGRVNTVIASFGFMRTLLQGGKVRPIAVTSLQRNPAMPDVPTVAEQVVPGYDAVNWMGLVTTAGTPMPVVNRLSTEISKLLKLPDVVAALQKDGTDPVGSSPEQFRALINEELTRWRNLVESRNIKMAQ
jgi:tripartite-type tricarboxylate transporter receptor subunit TctC